MIGSKRTDAPVLDGLARSGVLVIEPAQFREYDLLPRLASQPGFECVSCG